MIVRNNKDNDSSILHGAIMEQYYAKKVLKKLQILLDESPVLLPESEVWLSLEELLNQLECLLRQEKITYEYFIKHPLLAQMLSDTRHISLGFFKYETFAIKLCGNYQISNENFPTLSRLTNSWNNYGLDRHNHCGYHYHYYKKVNGTYKKANAIMTFDPDEPYSQGVKINTVFWEKHNKKSCAKCSPNNFGKNKKAQIYNAMYLFLTEKNKLKFRTPSLKAQILYQ